MKGRGWRTRKGGKRRRRTESKRQNCKEGFTTLHLPPLSLSCGVSVKTNNHNKLLAIRRNKFYRKSRRSDQIRSKERERQMGKSAVKARRGPQLFSSHTIFGDDVIIHKKKKIEKEKCVCASGSTRTKGRGRRWEEKEGRQGEGEMLEMKTSEIKR